MPLPLPMNGAWCITGASRGIGRAIAYELADRGIPLVLVGRDETALNDAARTAMRRGAPRAAVLTADLARPLEVERLADRIALVEPELQGLVNNAGFSAFGDAVAHGEAEAAAQIDANARAALVLTRRFLPGFKAAGRGYLLNVASVTAFQAVPRWAVYAATKTFLLHFSVALHHEASEYGVHVTALCPGTTRTAFFDRAKVDLATARFARWSTISTPEAAARIGVRAVLRNRPIATVGLFNRFVLALQRISPRPVVQAISSWATS